MSRENTSEQRDAIQRREEFMRVITWLDERGYHIEHGLGVDATLCRFGGFRMGHMADAYARDTRS